MSPMQHFRKLFVVLSLVLVLVTTSACGAATQTRDTAYSPTDKTTVGYGQIERGNTASGQDFGSWVVQTSKGLIQDAYVRDNDKLGAVISPQVKPDEVRPLARSLVQGFHKTAPDRDLKVLMYAPDKKLILTATYDKSKNQVHYE